MHECTSPPQTPTPRTTGNNSQPTVSTMINDPTKAENTTQKMSSLSPPITVANAAVVAAAAVATTVATATVNNMQCNAQQSSTTPNLFVPNGNLNVSQLDLEFPKLTPPKSKSPR